VSNVSIKTVKEVDAIRVASQMAAETLLGVGDILRPGMTTEEIDRFVHEDTLRRGGWPAPLNYHGFPKSVCTSINEIVCHGIPGARVLEPGDIINVDVTTIVAGYHGDTSATFFVGKPSPEAQHVTEVARRSLEIGIAEVRDGARLGDIGAAIQHFAEGEGCSVVRAFVGHGIGRKFHEAPQVAHVGERGKGDRIRAGMCFTIEPMVNVGGHEVEILEDKWTVVTIDRSLSAQFEHTLVVTKAGCEVLTRRSRRLEASEIFPSPYATPAIKPVAQAAASILR
jgi:methionyl aminopeptidase